MLECGGRVETLLEEMVRKRSGKTIEHKRLPEFIDAEIKSRIEKMPVG